MSALPGVGDAFGAFAKGGKARKLVMAFHKVAEQQESGDFHVTAPKDEVHL